MKTSVIESLQAFVLARPPVVAFTLSVIAITLAIFLVAFRIKDKELILDLHAQEDWKNFLGHLSNQKFCINMSSFEESSRLTVINEPQPSSVTKLQNMTFIPVTINNITVSQKELLRSLVRGGVVKFDGFFRLEGWKKSCPHHKKSALESDDSVSFALIMPSKSIESMENVSSCMYLIGPSELFPTVNSTHMSTNSAPFEQCQSLTDNVRERVGVKMVPYDTVGHSEDSVCSRDNTVQFSHDSTNLGPKIYLTENDRMQIFSNLLLAGYVSLGVISILLLTAVLQGRSLVLFRQHSLLPTKETMT